MVVKGHSCFLSFFFSLSLSHVFCLFVQRKVEDRLGSGPTGAQEMKNHAFFGDLNWDCVLKKQYVPEFVPPNRSGPTDVCNFEVLEPP
jgi:hypothetical protein